MMKYFIFNSFDYELLKAFDWRPVQSFELACPPNADNFHPWCFTIKFVCSSKGDQMFCFF